MVSFKNNLLIILTVINFISCTKKVIRGVPESVMEFYSPAPEFRCLDGLTTIPYSRLNDDYCDCQDGSDEPGTPACPNGIFHCRNTGFKPVNIPSSRVNDGICDCCDASDESNNTNCPNTCTELSHTLQFAQKKQIEFLKAGGEKRLEMIRRAREVKLEKTERYNELQRMKFKVEKDRINKEKAKKDAEYLEEVILANFDQEERENWKQNGLNPDDLQNIDDEDTTVSEIQNSSLEPETKAILINAIHARHATRQADRTLREIQLEASLITSYFERDFGPDSEFQSLADKCFEMRDMEYLYKICPFNKVYQESKYGGSETVLGEWGFWNEKYSQMVFENGAACWNAPNRSAKVNLICGLENHILNVTEPNKCQYEFHFETPAVCYDFSGDAPEIDEHDEL